MRAERRGWQAARKLRPTLILSTLICLVVAGVIVAFAVRSTGNPARHVDLNDGGIWATNNSLGLFGHYNKPAEQLQGGFLSPNGSGVSADLDVVQNESNAIAWDRGRGQLYAINPYTARPSAAAVGIQSGFQLVLGGHSAAVLDPATGRLWITRLGGDGVPDISRLESHGKARITVGRDAAVAVGTDGTVYAVSGAAKTLIRFDPSDDDFQAPRRESLAQTVKQPQLTVVGQHPVVFDAQHHRLLIPGGRQISLQAGSDGGKVALQQPGPDSDVAYVETGTALLAVPLRGGEAKKITTGQAFGTPSNPVFLDGCVHGLWGGSPAGMYVRSCHGKTDEPVRFQPGTDRLSTTQPVFRVNWHQIIVNDLHSGAIYVVTPEVQEKSNWQTLVPKIVQQKDNKKKSTADSNANRQVPPKAMPDHLGARSNRINVLHVLDNDSNPSGGIVSVNTVTPSVVQGARLTIAPDGQSILMDVPAGARGGDRSFSYTIDNGNGKTSNAATVTVSLRGDSTQNTSPAVRKGAKKISESTTAGATVEYPVLTDWRDADSDPLVISSASVTGGSVSSSADGRLTIITPSNLAAATVKYDVSDGYGGTAHGQFVIKLQDPRESTATKPVAEPDVVRGAVNTPIRIEPLANDLPGSDPTDPTAKLTLAGNAAVDSGNATLLTDQINGILTFTARAPGTYLLNYRAAFGASAAVPGTVRVDVDAATKSGIIATPDVALVHGQQATVVDVLANDFDVSGAAMVVTQSRESDPAHQVEVAIIDGRWLRINAVNPNLDGPVTVKYTVSDGAQGQAVGEVSITQLPASAHDSPPIPQDDAAKVRVQDSTTVPVLDNDSDPDGDQLSLAKVALNVHPKLGSAQVYGNQVRYIAPDKVTQETTVTVDYVVTDPQYAQATGHLTVTIEPPPNHDNSAPVPKLVTRGVVSGDTANIAIPVTGVDPDGDTVSVIGIDSPPSLGRVQGISANAISYQAYPDRSGTDSFTYVVQDRYGATGTATVRVAVTEPTDPQPPVAVDDVITAAPGAQVSVAVTGNDYVSSPQSVSVNLPKANGELPRGTKFNSSDVLSTTAPDSGNLTIAYDLSDGSGAQPSRGRLHVQVVPGFNNPPEVHDDSAKALTKGDHTTVDVLANDTDPDGAANSLHLVSVSGGNPGTRVVDGKVQVTYGEYPRTVAYVVEDSDKTHPASAIGLLHVPARSSNRPVIKPNVSEVVLKKGQTKDIAIADYVTDPTGKGLKLTTTDRIWASPVDGLRATSKDATTLRLSAQNPYVGPAAVTFEVTDGDPKSPVVLTLPVRIGPEAPVIRCPPTTLTLVEGGRPVTIDVATQCHVWTDSGDLEKTSFKYGWTKQVSGVELSQGGPSNRRLTLRASGSARPGATGTVRIGADNAKDSRIGVRIVAAPPAELNPITVDGLTAGKARTIDISSYLRTSLADARPQVISVQPHDDAHATASFSGSHITVTPAAHTHGQMVFDVRATDVAGHNDRAVTGVLTVSVRDRPDAPGNPRATTSASQTAVFTFSTPAPNGAPITGFEVTDNHGGNHRCAGSPCTITGLRNGTPVSFRVRAINAVGKSDYSAPSNQVVPDQLPNAPAGVTAVAGDQATTVRWQPPPPNGGTPVKQYQVQISPNPGTGVARQSVSAGTRQAAFRGLTNGTAYTFRVLAVNGRGPGPWSGAAGATPFGSPTAPAQPSVQTVQNADQSSQSLRVNWNTPNGNGRPIVHYTVRVFVGGSPAQSVNVTGTSYVRSVTNNGQSYSFDVTATNGGNKTSPPSARSAAVTAAGRPAQMAAPRAVARGTDGQVTVTYRAPAAHGAAISGYVVTYSGGQRSCPAASCTITGLTDGQTYAFRVYARNSRGNGPPSTPSAGAMPYGPPHKPTVTLTRVGPHSPNVRFSYHVDRQNGRPQSCSIELTATDAMQGRCDAGMSDSGTKNVGYNKTVRLLIRVTNTAGQSSQASVQVTTGSKEPPKNPSVRLEHGENETCSDGGTNCKRVIVIVDDFAANKNYHVHFQGRVTPWNNGGRDFDDTTDGTGHFRHVTGQWYANFGTKIDVTIGGKTYACDW